MVDCRITSEPIDVQELMGRVRTDSDGAVLLFTGVVRNHNEGRAVEGLQYEAYAEMAGGVLTRIAEEVASRYDVGAIAVSHRVGDLKVGDVSVAIAVAAPHRDPAYRASREIIERLKREAPIWKRERYADGAEGWVKGTEPEVGQAR